MNHLAEKVGFELRGDVMLDPDDKQEKKRSRPIKQLILRNCAREFQRPFHEFSDLPLC